MPNPNASNPTTGLIIFYCGCEADEEGTVAVGRTILEQMEYKGEPGGGGGGVSHMVKLTELR